MIAWNPCVDSIGQATRKPRLVDPRPTMKSVPNQKTSGESSAPMIRFR
jgi:hypothetical protein